MPVRAVVFAYHNVGVRCLKVLLAHGVQVPLVVTHEDNPQEHIWFESAAAAAAQYRITAIAPVDPNISDIVDRVAACRPDFLFSFYYRAMLKSLFCRSTADAFRSTGRSFAARQKRARRSTT